MQGPISLKNKIVSTSLLPKTSTPIRARIISRDLPMNSTPINQLKLCVSPTANKENIDSSNVATNNSKHYELISNKIAHGQNLRASNTISFADFNFNKKQTQNLMAGAIQIINQKNQSPILSLIKKSHKLQQSSLFSSNTFRSLTPNNINKNNYQTLNSSKQKPFNPINSKNHSFNTLNQSSSSSNLRTSNSFSNLFEPRSKTPTRLGSMAFGSLSRKKNPSPGGENEKLFNKKSHRYRGESQQGLDSTNGQLSQDSFNNSFVDGGRVMCMNNHGKAAKYKIKTSEQHDNKEVQNFVYCSKCAIDMVQKGFSVQQLQDSNSMSQLSSPRELQQSKSFKPNFMSFKTSYNSQMLERLRTVEQLKVLIGEKMAQVARRREIVQRKVNREMEAIDCYYDSIVCYVQQQRVKDKQVVETLSKQILDRQKHDNEVILHKYHGVLELSLRNRAFDSNSLSMMSQIQNHLNTLNHPSQNIKPHFQQIFDNQQKGLLTYSSSIQQQFDEFVSHFDTKAKLQYKTLDETRNIPKNNALRFSFQKALQNQKHKKTLISDSGMMNPLQQESEQDCDENSFSHDHMKQTAQSTDNFEQKPFRTLFAQDDNILDQDDEDTVKNDMYSPTFKSI